MAIKLVQGKQIATASWAINALTASYLEGYISPFPFTGSALITGSLGVTGSINVTQGITGSLFGTASFAISSSNSISSSFATTSTSASFAISSSTVQSIANNITNNVNNNVLTATGGSTINGEGNLTFDGGLLNINGQLQQGESVLARGDYSHAEGIFTTAPGNYSHAEGKSTQAIGDYSHAEGERTNTGTETGYLTDNRIEIVDGLITLESDYGDVTGNFTPGGYLYMYDVDFGNIIERNVYLIDTVTCSPIVGSSTEIQLIDTTVNTPQAIVGDLTTLLNAGDFGGDQLVPGLYSHTEGNLTSAIGLHSHTEGESTNAIGNISHAEGNETQAIGVASHAEGFRTQAIGFASHAEGNYTQATGDYSHAEGTGTQAIGQASHAEGNETQAIGEGSHAEGLGSQAIGNYSHAEGVGTITVGRYQHVQGQYNITSSVESAFIHGNGTDTNNRSNLIFAYDSTVEITGSLKISGSITGSLFGTSSYAVTALSSSYALTASNAPNYLPLTGGVITGNLQVIGTASFAYTTASIVEVGASTIILNTDFPAVRFGGISVIDSGSFGNSSTGSLFWDSLNNRWVYSNPSGSTYDGGLLISGPRNTSGLGNETGMDSNFVAVGQGADHIRPGSIFNSGSITIVTGSFTSTATTLLNTVSGNTAVGLSSDTTTARLQVRGTGATSATNTLILQNSSLTDLLTVKDDGSSTLIGRLNITPTTSTTSSLVVTGPTLLSGSQNTISGSVLTVVGSGSAQPVFTVQGSQGELFSVTDSLSGSLFSVNDISGLPIMEVFSDGTTLMGNYLDPMLVTTAKNVLTNSGSFTIYSLPTASYDAAFFDYSVRSGSNARAGQIMAIQSGSVVNYTETTTMDFGSTSGLSLGVFVSGSNMVLTGSAATTAWTIKTIIRSI